MCAAAVTRRGEECGCFDGRCVRISCCCIWASVWADAVEACIIAQASVGMLFERARAVSWGAEGVGRDGARLWSRGLVVSAGVYGCTERAERTFLGSIGGGRSDGCEDRPVTSLC